MWSFLFGFVLIEVNRMLVVMIIVIYVMYFRVVMCRFDC